MSEGQWMIYGAYGYSGRLIVEEAVRKGLKPVLAGRSEAKLAEMARSFELPYRAFNLDNPDYVAQQLMEMKVVLHCAGPFSVTGPPMMEACLLSFTHYLDITGEIDIFEHAYGLHGQAQKAGIVLCPGVGFDVIPTDCVAATLKAALPDATHLTLGFDSRSGFSPGTAKTSVEGLAKGGKVRREGILTTVPLAYKTRRIDFGDGEKMAVTIPWGDVSTAYHTTGIPNIEVYIPSSPKMIAQMKRMRWIRPLLRLGFVQGLAKRKIEKKVRGPSEQQRSRTPTFVWGEVTNAAGAGKTAFLQTANGYSVTATGSVTVAEKLLADGATPGFTTPAMLMGPDFASSLPDSSPIKISS